MADNPLCICGCRKKGHDLERCDKRCLIHADCTHFRLAAFQPDEKIVHRHGHGPKPGKGLPSMFDIKEMGR